MFLSSFFFFNDTATTEIYTLSLHDALPISHQHFLPVTDEVIRWHLCGQDDKGREFVMGVYPMLRDETCFFLAADFDKATWQQDAGAFLETCRQMSVPAALERSRSGNGGDRLVFFYS